MTKGEKLAFEYGATFNRSATPAGYSPAPCFDTRMHSLVSNSHTARGFARNERNLKAWYTGYATTHTGEGVTA